MKIFVPKYRHNAPHKNKQVSNAMLVEVHRHDLPTILDFWENLDRTIKFESVNEFFQTNARDLCNPDYLMPKHTLEPFLRRPHITVHAGSKDGAEHCRDIILESAYTSGRLVARNGFNLWYGGGNEGAMGAIIRGFNDQLEISGRRPDQYSVQVVPAPFVFGVKSANGLAPVNEGLCDITDAAIIMPDFNTRRIMLDDRSIAITNPGGTGSLDEWSDVVVHIKTGLRSDALPLYTLSPYIEALGEGYYDGLKRLVDNFVLCGLESPKTLNHIHFKENATQAFEHMIPFLVARNELPDQVYNSYCEKHGVSPGIPSKKKAAAPALAEAVI